MSGFTPPYFYQKFFLPDGTPAAGGSLTFTVAGSTTIPKQVFIDYAMTLPYTGPLVLDASGVAPQYFMEVGLYRIVLKDSTDVTVDIFDNIEGINTGGIAVTGDHKVAMDATDTADYIPSKVLGSASINADVVTEIGGNKTLNLSIKPEGIPQFGKVRASATDSTSDTLDGKLVPFVGITLDVITGGAGYQWINVASLGYVAVGTGDQVRQGTLDEKLQPGNGIATAVTSFGASGNRLVVSTNGKTPVKAGDTVWGYLNEKLIAGAGITITEVTDVTYGTRLVINARGNSWRLLTYATSNYTVLDTDDTIVVRAAAINVTLPTPSAAYEGRVVTIRSAGMGFTATILGAVIGSSTLSGLGKLEVICFNTGSGYFWVQQ